MAEEYGRGGSQQTKITVSIMCNNRSFCPCRVQMYRIIASKSIENLYNFEQLHLHPCIKISKTFTSVTGEGQFLRVKKLLTSTSAAGYASTTSTFIEFSILTSDTSLLLQSL